jgi:hypothetical protein
MAHGHAGQADVNDIEGPAGHGQQERSAPAEATAVNQATTTRSRTLTDADVRTLDAYWRAANYLAAGQTYLMGNPLLAEPLRPEHIKPRLLGHWAPRPG